MVKIERKDKNSFSILNYGLAKSKLKKSNQGNVQQFLKSLSEIKYSIGIFEYGV
jgi:hypothetical protein